MNGESVMQFVILPLGISTMWNVRVYYQCLTSSESLFTSSMIFSTFSWVTGCTKMAFNAFSVSSLVSKLTRFVSVRFVQWCWLTQSRTGHPFPEMVVQYVRNGRSTLIFSRSTVYYLVCDHCEGILNSRIKIKRFAANAGEERASETENFLIRG